jgi:ATP-dependent exoDNAse (exonuclease V) alpha subunit
MLGTRELIYTAISRAQYLLVAIGKEDVLKAQARRVSLVKRKTFLAELLKEEMGVP